MTSWYCPLPFKHAFVDSKGIAACCQTPRYQTTLDQWPSHPKLVELQQQLLSGQQPQVCRDCVKQEQTQQRSLRTDSNRDYEDQIFTETDIDFVDFRSINICNFKCRSCFPEFSHGIAQELNNHTELRNFFGQPLAEKTVSVSDANVDWIVNHLGSLKRIMFTGGEPTKIAEIRKLINIIKRDHKDLAILITSNASFEDHFWYEITEELPNLHWTVSIDAVGPRAEIVRHGSQWSVIEKNVTWLAQHANSLDINSVVSNVSVFGLRSLLEFGHSMQQLSISPSGRHGDTGCRHQFHVCQRPYWLTVDNWPDDLKYKLQTYLNSCMSLRLDEEQQNMLTGLIDQLNNARFDPKLWEKTQLYNKQLDLIRNENHLILYEPQS